MFRKSVIAILAAAMVMVLVLSAYQAGFAQTGVGVGDVANADAIGDEFSQGSANRNGGPGGPPAGTQELPPVGELSAAEAQSLAFMVEEEKLARDVYQALYEKWGLAAFQNIGRSEQTHMDAIAQLISRYGLSSPVHAEAGMFTDPALQTLYTELIARGSQSLAEAIQVGGLIEEIDILDLQTRIGETDNADIQQVYNNLLNGSYNHLRAFSNSLSNQTGETYQPQELSASAYQAILTGSQGGGNGRGNGRWGRGGA